MHDDRLGTGALIILPTYNEREQLSRITTEIREALPHAALLIIDDSSPDGTGALANSLARNDPGITVLHRAGKLGLASAYIAGFQFAHTAGYKYIVQMDADGSHQVTDLVNLLTEARTGVGLVVGTRWMPGGSINGWAAHRRWVSRIGTAVARLCLRSRLRDITSGFRVFDAEWLASVDLTRVESQGYSFQVEIAWALERYGCPISEIPIAFIERRSGHSKMTVGIVFEALARVIRWGLQLRFTPNRLRMPIGGTAARQ